MRVLVACEFSQVVCKAFRGKGHEAYSCDILPTEGNPEWHIQDDVLKHLDDGWGLMIAHPPCTYLSYVGNRYWDRPDRYKDRLHAIQFFITLVEAPINRICIENPMGIMSKVYRQHDQVIHPYYFGDSATKRTCLWLKNLPKLEYSLKENMMFAMTATSKPEPMYYLKTNGKPIQYTEAIHGGQKRSIFWQGISTAMANQWGNLE